MLLAMIRFEFDDLNSEYPPSLYLIRSMATTLIPQDFLISEREKILISSSCFVEAKSLSSPLTEEFEKLSDSDCTLHIDMCQTQQISWTAKN